MRWIPVALIVGYLVQISGGGARSFDTAFMFLIGAILVSSLVGMTFPRSRMEVVAEVPASRRLVPLDRVSSHNYRMAAGGKGSRCQPIEPCNWGSASCKRSAGVPKPRSVFRGLLKNCFLSVILSAAKDLLFACVRSKADPSVAQNRRGLRMTLLRVF